MMCCLKSRMSEIVQIIYDSSERDELVRNQN